jgi:hypothetical protein
VILPFPLEDRFQMMEKHHSSFSESKKYEFKKYEFGGDYGIL